MTSEEKFHKILQRAEQNGFQIDKKVFLNHEDAPPVMALLFNKAFAKSVWGEEDKREKSKHSEVFINANWKHHLQQAVISDDPIDYYYENMTKKKH